MKRRFKYLNWISRERKELFIKIWISRERKELFIKIFHNYLKWKIADSSFKFEQVNVRWSIKVWNLESPRYWLVYIWQVYYGLSGLLILRCSIRVPFKPFIYWFSFKNFCDKTSLAEYFSELLAMPQGKIWRPLDLLKVNNRITRKCVKYVRS